MQKFLTWFDKEEPVSSVIRSAIAHFWFVSIHPFEDGNGRLARILSDMLLARGEKSEFRFYNVSSQINKDKNHYYDILERMQHGDGDITEWLAWYLQKLVNALDEADTIVTTILNKSFFWQKASAVPICLVSTAHFFGILPHHLGGLLFSLVDDIDARRSQCAGKDIFPIEHFVQAETGADGPDNGNQRVVDGHLANRIAGE